MKLKRNPAPKVMAEAESHLSAFHCKPCNLPLTKEQGDRIVAWSAGVCGNCKDSIGENNAVLAVAPSSAHLLGDDAYTTSWFHATDNPNWLEDVTKGNLIPYVHVGTLEAAEALMLDKYLPREGSETLYIYELTIDKGAKLSKNVMVDEDRWPSYVSDKVSWGVTGQGVRYINRYEALGSISLLIDPSVLEVKSVQKLEA